MKIFTTILLLVILAVVFLPVYNGRVRCGVVDTCFAEKLNLIEYIKYKNRSQVELLKECPDEMILNKMPMVGHSKIPSSYYIKDGARTEISDYDGVWVAANCTVPVQEVY